MPAPQNEGVPLITVPLLRPSAARSGHGHKDQLRHALNPCTSEISESGVGECDQIKQRSLTFHNLHGMTSNLYLPGETRRFQVHIWHVDLVAVDYFAAGVN